MFRKEVSKLQDERLHRLIIMVSRGSWECRAQCHQVIEEQRRHFEEEKQQLTEQRQAKYISIADNNYRMWLGQG